MSEVDKRTIGIASIILFYLLYRKRIAEAGEIPPGIEIMELPTPMAISVKEPSLFVDYPESIYIEYPGLMVWYQQKLLQPAKISPLNSTVTIKKI